MASFKTESVPKHSVFRMFGRFSRWGISLWWCMKPESSVTDIERRLNNLNIVFLLCYMFRSHRDHHQAVLIHEYNNFIQNFIQYSSLKVKPIYR
jgi:hypothetical protein